MASFCLCREVFAENISWWRYVGLFVWFFALINSSLMTLVFVFRYTLIVNHRIQNLILYSLLFNVYFVATVHNVFIYGVSLYCTIAIFKTIKSRNFYSISEHAAKTQCQINRMLIIQVILSFMMNIFSNNSMHSIVPLSDSPEMPSWLESARRVEKLESITAAFSSLFFNVDLAALALTEHNNRILRDYSKVILIMCFTDLIFTLTDFVFEMVCILLGNYRFLVTGSLMARFIRQYFENAGETFFCHIWLFAIFFSLTTLAAQFVFRYLLLYKSIMLNAQKFFALLTTLSLWLIPYAILLFLLNNLYMNSGKNFHLLRNISHILEDDPSKFGICFIMHENSKLSPIISFYVVICSSFLFLIILFCGMKIYYISLRSVVQKFNAKIVRKTERASVRQISLTLIVQGILPFIVVLFPNTLVICYYLYPKLAEFIAAMITIPYSWLPVFNPLIAIIVVRAYRRAIIRYILHSLLPKALQGALNNNPSQIKTTNHLTYNLNNTTIIE